MARAANQEKQQKKKPKENISAPFERGTIQDVTRSLGKKGGTRENNKRRDAAHRLFPGRGVGRRGIRPRRFEKKVCS